MHIFLKKLYKMFGGIEKYAYLCIAIKENGSVAQLNRASDYGSEGYRFESCRSHKEELLEFLFFFFNPLIYFSKGCLYGSTGCKLT